MKEADGSGLEWKRLGFAVGCAVLVRAALFWVAWHRSGIAAIAAGDSGSYLRPGWEMLRHGCFCTTGAVEIDRTPGYPLYAMVFGGLWGRKLLVVTSQIVLSAVTVVLAAMVARRVFQRTQAGTAAAFLMALEPLSVESSVRLLSETLFVFLLLLLLLCLLWWAEDRGVRWPVASGCLLAAMSYVRPVGYWLWIPITLMMPVVVSGLYGSGGSWRKVAPWKQAAVFLGVFLLLVAPWQMRNLRETGYAGFSAVADKNLYFYLAGAVLAQQRGQSLETWQVESAMDDPVRWVRLHPEQHLWAAAQRDEWLRKQALQVLLRDSWLFLETYVSGEARLLFSPGASEFFRLTGRQGDGLMGGAQRRWTGWQWLTAACFEGYLLLLYGLAGKVWWRHCVYRGSLWLLGGVALYFFVVSGGGQAVSRLRLPAMAIVCVLAGGGTDKRSERSCGDPGRI